MDLNKETTIVNIDGKKYRYLIEPAEPTSLGYNVRIWDENWFLTKNFFMQENELKIMMSIT